MQNKHVLVYNRYLMQADCTNILKLMHCLVIIYLSFEINAHLSFSKLHNGIIIVMAGILMMQINMSLLKPQSVLIFRQQHCRDDSQGTSRSERFQGNGLCLQKTFKYYYQADSCEWGKCIYMATVYVGWSKLCPNMF